MTQIANRKENTRSQTRQARHVEIVVTGKTGFFGKVLALVAFVILLPLTFFFSVLFFSILLALALMLIAYAWWIFRRVRRISGPFIKESSDVEESGHHSTRLPLESKESPPDSHNRV